MERWAIFDWAGNQLWEQDFPSWENAWDFIRSQYFDEEDWKDIYVDLLPTEWVKNGKNRQV